MLFQNFWDALLCFKLIGDESDLVGLTRLYGLTPGVNAKLLASCAFQGLYPPTDRCPLP